MEASKTPQLQSEPDHPEGTVRALDDHLLIAQLTVHDERAARLVRQRQEAGEDPARTVATAIEIGARALDREQVEADVEFVRREYERVMADHRRDFERQQQEMIGRIEHELRQAFGDDAKTGRLAEELDRHNREMDQAIEATFGDGNTEGVQEKIRVLVEERNEAFLRRLSADDEANPLRPLLTGFNKWVRERREAQDDRDEKLERKLDEVLVKASEAMGVNRAADELAEAERAGTRKGRSFEDRVQAVLELVASSRGDVAHHVGDTSAEQGGKKGDTVIEIGAEAGSVLGRVAVEAKTDRSLTKPDAWRELNGALEKRDAGYAVMIVAGEECVPSNTKPWLEYEGDKMIVAVNPEQPEQLILEAAYTIARFRVLARSERELEVDAAGVRESVEQSLEELRALSTAKRHLTGVTNSAENARALLAEMEQRLRAHLSRIDELVARGGDETD